MMRILSSRGRKRFDPNLKGARFQRMLSACLNEIDSATTNSLLGKNPLGDRNEFLPTVHGFDVFFGNLYHLNAEEEPENPDYPQSPNFKAQFGPRGVLKCVATTTDTLGDDPRFGP